jgi:hypothetical protein
VRETAFPLSVRAEAFCSGGGTPERYCRNQEDAAHHEEHHGKISGCGPHHRKYCRRKKAKKKTERDLERPVIAATAERLATEAFRAQSRHAIHEVGERSQALFREWDRSWPQQAKD